MQALQGSLLIGNMYTMTFKAKNHGTEIFRLLSSHKVNKHGTYGRFLSFFVC